MILLIAFSRRQADASIISGGTCPAIPWDVSDRFRIVNINCIPNRYFGSIVIMDFRVPRYFG